MTSIPTRSSRRRRFGTWPRTVLLWAALAWQCAYPFVIGRPDAVADYVLFFVGVLFVGVALIVYLRLV